MFEIGFHNFPDDDVNESKKAESSFGLGCARALFSRFSSKGDARLMDLYANGDQPTGKYKFKNKTKKGKKHVNYEVYSDLIKETGSDEVFTNIDYTISSPAPKAVSVLLSTMQEKVFLPSANFLDSLSMSKKDMKKYSLYVASKFINPLRQKMGLPTMRLPFEPLDINHLEIMAKTGAFKLEEEAALEKIANSGFKMSTYDLLRTQLNRSAIVHHARAAKIYNDPITGINKLKYIDFANLCCIWNESNEEQPVAIGHIERKSIRDIYESLVASGVKEEDINKLAKQYRNEYGNDRGCSDAWFEKPDENTKKWRWLDFKVDVMEFVYLTRNTVQYSYQEKDKIYKKDKGLDKNKKDAIHFPCNYWYEGNYVIGKDGNDLIYGWQKMRNQMQNRLNPMCPYIVSLIPGLSPIKRAMGHLDDIQFAVCKLRGAQWWAAPKGYTIDLGASANIKIGGKEYNIFELLQVYRQTGLRIVASKATTNGTRVDVPMTDNDNGIGKQAQEWKDLIIHHTYMFMQDVGLNENMVGAPSQSAERLPGQIEQDVIAGNRGNWILQQYEKIFTTECSKRLIYQTIADIQNDEYIAKSYESVISKRNVDLVKEMDFNKLEEVGIEVVSVEMEKTIDEIMARAVEMSKAMSRDGKVMLKQSDLENIRMLLSNYEIKDAINAMTTAEALSDKREKEWQEKMAQDTIAGQQQSSMVSEEEKRKTIAMTNDLEINKARMLAEIEVNKTIQIEEAKSRFRVIEGEQKSENKKEEMVVEGTIEAKNKQEITGSI